MWRQVLSVNLSVPFEDFTTDYQFNSPLIMLEAISDSEFNDNYRIGKFRPVYVTNTVINNAKSYYRTIRLQKQFIKFLELPYSFKLQFFWYVWLPRLTLNFYEPQYADVIDLATIQGTLIEQRANLAYIQRAIDSIEQTSGQ